jgi:hypothetical protein
MYSINSFHLDVQTAQSANSPKITSDVSNHRRTLLLTSSALVLGGTTSAKSANALPLFEKKNRRQLELCIVNVLRIQYWSRNIADKLQNAETEEEKRKAYLEARLAAKAMVADRKIKVGGGASYFVLTLRGLQIKEVLEDLRYYAKSKVMDQYKDDLIESLASLVEFDGLETTQDPSPRSTLTLSMYTNDKNIFVRRMLTERIIPLTDQIVYLFGKESVKQCESYIEQYYPTELPKQPTQQQAERIKETVTEKEG